ncbi:MAG: putative phosphatidylinositol synthase [Anaerolineales bacterium]|nr:putative phosphatidylinositol synthase [Anaerolineales bacterium]
MQAEDAAKKRLTLTDWMRQRLKGVIEPAADFFIRLGVHPNTMTLIGLGGNIVGALFLAFGYMTVGGLFILVSGPFDGLDGTMARRLNQPSQFGAFVDSVTDRWSEMFIFMGLLFFYLQHGQVLACMLVFAATMGSVMVSYTKSRAEALGFDCNVGVLTRMERYLVMAPALLFNVPIVALWVIAVLANITAIQRTAYVRKQAFQKGWFATLKRPPELPDKPKS